MNPFKRWPHRLVAATASLGGLAGCAGLLGYQYTGAYCSFDTDCSEGATCVEGKCASAATCVTGTASCEACAPSSGCIADSGMAPEVIEATTPWTPVLGEADSEPLVVDAGEPEAPWLEGAAPKATNSTCNAPDGAAIDLTSDPQNCGRCGVACSFPQGVCIQSVCRQPFKYGNEAPDALPNSKWVVSGPENPDLDSGAGELSGVLVHLPAGWLVGIGLMSMYGGPSGYLGVYTSVDGRPSKLIASTPLFTVNGSETSSNPQSTDESVPPTAITDADYWVLGMWDDNVYFAVATDVATPDCSEGCWYAIPTEFAPLPGVAPAQSELYVSPIPSVYAFVSTQ